MRNTIGGRKRERRQVAPGVLILYKSDVGDYESFWRKPFSTLFAAGNHVRSYERKVFGNRAKMRVELAVLIRSVSHASRSIGNIKKCSEKSSFPFEEKFLFDN